MNKKLKKIKQINRKPIPVVSIEPKQTNSILQSIKNVVLGFLTLALLVVEFGSVPAQALPVTDNIVSSNNFTCTQYANSNNNFNCGTFLNGGVWEFPSDFKLGVGTSPGGLCTIVSSNYYRCDNIPVTSIAGVNNLNYSGTGLMGGITNNMVTVLDLLTPAQDLATPKNCNSTLANSDTGICTFSLPAGSILPDNYKLSTPLSSFTYCVIEGYPSVTCRNIRTGGIAGSQPIISTLNPTGANGNINIYPYITAAEDITIQYFCNPVKIGTTTTCYGNLPPNKSMPTVFKMGVGAIPSSDNCVVVSSYQIQCYNVPTSMIAGQNSINSTLNPNGTGSSSNLTGILTSSDEATLDIICDPANTNSTTNCHSYNIYGLNNYYPNLYLPSNYQLGVGTVLGGTCTLENNYTVGPGMFCFNVPTGPIADDNTTINSTLRPNGTNFTSILNDSLCLYSSELDYRPTDSLNISDIFQPIIASASAPTPVPDCCPVHPQVLGCPAIAQGGGGTIQISTQIANGDKKALTESSVQSSSQSTTSTNETVPIPSTPTNPEISAQTQILTPIETASTKIYDPFKLYNGKKRPVSGVLSSVDDKSSIEDPYICAGDIHGFVDYSGDYNNVEVRVEIKDSVSGIVTNLPAELDPITHLYVAKVDYGTVKESNYDINYSVYSRLTKKILDQGNYSAFITQNCKKVKPVVQNENAVILSRTGGGSNIVNTSLILLVVLGFVSIMSFWNGSEEE